MSDQRYPVVKPRDPSLAENYTIKSYYNDTWEVTFFGHTQKKFGHRTSLDFAGLIRHIAVPQRTAEHWDDEGEEKKWEKKSQKCFAPVVYRDNRRLGKMVEYCTIMVWDCDCGRVTYDDVLNFLKENRIQFIMHTSYSHKPDHHKFRVLFPLVRPFPKQYWEAYAQVSKNLFFKTFGSHPDLQAIENCATTYNCCYATKHTRCDWFEGKRGDSRVDIFDKVQQRFAEIQEAKSKRLIDRQWESSPKRRARPCDIDDRSNRIARLNVDRGCREKFALFLGATKKGTFWRKWDCPGCGKRDATSFHEKSGRAFCNHKNSCGESWLLPELAKLKNWRG